MQPLSAVCAFDGGHRLYALEAGGTARVRDEVKQQSPHCKIVLIVDENAEKELARHVLQAKKDGLIDNFIYGSVSDAYLSAVIDTL